MQKEDELKQAQEEAEEKERQSQEEAVKEESAIGEVSEEDDLDIADLHSAFAKFENQDKVEVSQEVLDSIFGRDDDLEEEEEEEDLVTENKPDLKDEL